MKIHKYLHDDPSSGVTACGRHIHGRTHPLTVDTDARKTNCGNCQRARTMFGYIAVAKK